MGEAIVIITEKKQVSTAIARAIAPEMFDERGYCSCEHTDIVSLRTEEERARINTPEDTLCVAVPLEKENYFCFDSRDCVNCKFVAQHIDQMGMKHARSVRRRLRYENDMLRDKRKPLTIFEDISYYVLERDGETVVIIDTQGTPFSHFIRYEGQRTTLENLILESKDWKSIEERLAYRAKIEKSSREPSSHMARERLFNNILAERNLPDGTPINLRRIIAATDYDIAGSYIFYSVVMNANQFIRRGQREKGMQAEEIPMDVLYRMKLQRMDPESVVEEFENPIPFDFGNAHAGELRDLFDFIYGTVLSSKIRRVTAKYSPDIKSSIGRVVFLGLGKLIEQEQAIKESGEEHYVYLVFNGLPDKEGVEKALAERNFSAFQLRQRKTHVSGSRFLRLLEADNIGTLTTRYKQPYILANLKLAEYDDAMIASTPFGAYYYHLLKPYINGDNFSLAEWNSFLYNTMESFRASSMEGGTAEHEWFKSKSRDFMEYFIMQFKEHLLSLRPYWERIGKDIAEGYSRLNIDFRRGKKSEGKPDIEVPDDVLLICGNDETLSLEQIEQFMDSSENRVKPAGSRVATVLRYTPPEPASIEDPIRRVCCIDSEYEFELVSAWHPLHIFTIDKGYYTVFRTAVSDEKALQKLIKAGLGINSYGEMRIDEAMLEQEESAHDPLSLTQVSPSDIQGREGLWLVREYNTPWKMTQDKLDKRRQGLINLSSFNNRDYRFERVERYEFGRVHKFETLLIAMLEKYNIPFWKTARMAEELYLGTGR